MARTATPSIETDTRITRDQQCATIIYWDNPCLHNTRNASPTFLLLAANSSMRIAEWFDEADIQYVTSLSVGITLVIHLRGAYNGVKARPIRFVTPL